jgi:hypothetical protein
MYKFTVVIKLIVLLNFSTVYRCLTVTIIFNLKRDGHA